MIPIGLFLIFFLVYGSSYWYFGLGRRKKGIIYTPYELEQMQQKTESKGK